MKYGITLLFLATLGLYSWMYDNQLKSNGIDAESSHSKTNTQNDKDIYSNYDYTDSNGNRLTIQNGYPRGGKQYIDPNGHVGGYAVFWTRIINETAKPIELSIDFPIKPYELSNFPGKYYKILVPDDLMTLDKFTLPSYGLTGIESFLDRKIHSPSSLKRTINPKESTGFYFVMLIMSEKATGMTRTELRLKGQDLIYKISRYSMTKPPKLVDEKEIHCGRINVKNLILRK